MNHSYSIQNGFGGRIDSQIAQVSAGILLNGVAKIAVYRGFGPSQQYIDSTSMVQKTANNFQTWSIAIAYQKSGSGKRSKSWERVALEGGYPNNLGLRRLGKKTKRRSSSSERTQTMKCIFSITAASLALLMATAAAQIASTQPDRNPERRGIRRLSDDEIKKLSTPRTKPKTFELDERKSIFVTDVEILKHFTFEELMEKLAHDSHSGLTKEQFFQQWWDTANPKTTFSLPFGGPNCDSGLVNTFPYASEERRPTSHIQCVWPSSHSCYCTRRSHRAIAST